MSGFQNDVEDFWIDLPWRGHAIKDFEVLVNKKWEKPPKQFIFGTKGKVEIRCFSPAKGFSSDKDAYDYVTFEFPEV